MLDRQGPVSKEDIHDVILTISKKNGMWLRRTMDSVKPVQAGKKEVYRLFVSRTTVFSFTCVIIKFQNLDENFFK